MNLYGFFIDKKVAEIIQGYLDGNIGSGYSTEAYNSRGIHFIDPSGKAEFNLENDYIKKAEGVDSNGYFKLGEILRKIAKSYHSKGLHNIEEHKQWEAASDEEED